MIILSVANNFSRTLGAVGKADAKLFRENILYPAFEQDSVTVDLNGTYGFSSLWLREVFGETALKYKNLITIKQFLDRITIISDDISLFGEIRDYIEDAYEVVVLPPTNISSTVNIEGVEITITLKEVHKSFYELSLNKILPSNDRSNKNTIFLSKGEVKELLYPFVNTFKKEFDNDTY